MRLSRRTAMALALLLGLLAVILGYLYLRGQKPSPELTQKVQLPVPLADIAGDTDLRKDMFTQAAFEAEQVPKEAITDPEQLQGLIALKDLPKGKPVLSTAVAKRSRSLALAYGIPQDYRAITVPVDDVSGVAGFIRPGDHIDLLAIFTDDTGKYSVVRTVLQDIEVLAVNTLTGAPSPEEKEQQEDEKKPKSRRGEENRTVTIAVTPHEAQMVAISHHRGELRMTLRRTGDGRMETLPRSQSWTLIGSFPVEKAVETTTTTAEPQPPSWSQMWGGPPTSQPQAQPAAKQPPAQPAKEPAVEVIRGSAREFVKPAD